MNNRAITIETFVKVTIEKAWECWTSPEHITKWAFASDDWEATSAQNDVRVGGKFVTTMAAKDKSTSFEFTGKHTFIKENAIIESIMYDGRKMKVEFSTLPKGTKVSETFEPEHENTLELQRQGWQAILDNFKKHAETH